MSSADLGVRFAVSSALRQSKALQRQGQLVQSLAAVEQVAHLSTAIDLASSWAIVKRIATLCNRLYSRSAGDDAMGLLHRAETVLEIYARRLSAEDQSPRGFFRLRSLTWNNLAAWHKRRGSPHMALHYLLKAHKAAGDAVDCGSLRATGQTRVNIAVLYAEMRRYAEAVGFAQSALVTLQQEMTLRRGGRKKYTDGIELLVVAFYTIGVCEEAMGHRAEAMEAYRNAVGIGQTHLKSAHKALFLARKAATDLQNIVDGTILPRQVATSLADRIRIVSLTPSPTASRKPTSPVEAHDPKPIPRPQTARNKYSKPSSRTNSQHSQKPELTKGRSASSLIGSVKVHYQEDDKYYSAESLAKMRRKREEASRLAFVSSDQYFMTKITKQLNVSKDIRYLRPFSAFTAMGAWNRDEDEKRMVSALRLKRHSHTMSRGGAHGLEVATRLIERLKEEDAVLEKHSSVKIQSRMKTKAFQKAMQETMDRRDAAGNTIVYPPQRLFFKAHNDGSPDRQGDCLPAPVAPASPKAQMPPAKEEIEKMMDELNLELRTLDPGRDSRSKHDSAKRTCELAASTIHHDAAVRTTVRRPEVPISPERVEKLASIVDRKKAAMLSAQQAVKVKTTVLFPY